MATLLMVSVFVAVICLLNPLLAYFYDKKGLRKYPGQNWASGITSLSTIWEHTRGFRTRQLSIQHRKNPIIRVAPNTLSFADVRAIPYIYGHSTPCRKDDVYLVTAGEHTHMVNVVDKEDHSRKRRMLSHAFAIRNLENWEFKIRDKVENMISQLDKRCNNFLPISDEKMEKSERNNVGMVDLRWWFNLFTIDAIADIVLSEKLHLLQLGTDSIVFNAYDGVEEGRQISFLNSLHEGHRISSAIVGATEWFPLLKSLTSLFCARFREQWEHAQNYGKIISYLVDKRVQRAEKDEDLDDIMQYLLKDKSGKDRCLVRGEIEAEVNALLDAGSETTSIALTHALYCLIKNPACLAKLRTEIQNAISKNDNVASYATVRNLPYLRACLDESLRLSPPISRGLARRTPPGGMKIVDEHIAGNTVVFISAYVAHRHPVLFPEPEAFQPERWLQEEEQVKAMRAVFIPFSTGARGCIGRNISIIEQQILLATLVHRYNFVLPSKDWTMAWKEAFNLWPVKMPVHIQKRV